MKYLDLNKATKNPYDPMFMQLKFKKDSFNISMYCFDLLKNKFPNLLVPIDYWKEMSDLLSVLYTLDYFFGEDYDKKFDTELLKNINNHFRDSASYENLELCNRIREVYTLKKLLNTQIIKYIVEI